MSTTTYAPTFAQAVAHSRGKIIWRNGVGPGMPCEIVHAGEDYLMVSRWDTDEMYAVPFHSILSFKYASEDD